MKQKEIALNIRPIRTDNDPFDEDHVVGSWETPLREDAFERTDSEKIDLIEGHFREIMITLGLDLNDDSLKGTPRRVAKMFVQEVFSGLNPKKQTSRQAF